MVASNWSLITLGNTLKPQGSLIFPAFSKEFVSAIPLYHQEREIILLSCKRYIRTCLYAGYVILLLYFHKFFPFIFVLLPLNNTQSHSSGKKNLMKVNI